jgi:hypothetical protein
MAHSQKAHPQNAQRYSGSGCLFATLIFDAASLVVLFGLRWWITDRIIPEAPADAGDFYQWIIRLCDVSALALAVVIVAKLILLPILRRRERSQPPRGPQPPPFRPPS